MKKVIVITRIETREVVNMDSRSKVIRNLFSPYSEQYVDYCNYFREIYKRYENAPLVRYRMTEFDKQELERNPDYINDIPRYVVKGFDAAVGGGFDGRARDEFYQRFQNADKEIVQFINDVNPFYKAEIKYVM